MRYHLTAFLAIVTLPTFVWAQNRVYTGEHGNFTRITIEVGQNNNASVQISAGELSVTFDKALPLNLAAAFDRLTTQRIESITQKSEFEVSISLGCECGVRDFVYAEQYLVVDISETFKNRPAHPVFNLSILASHRPSSYFLNSRLPVFLKAIEGVAEETSVAARKPAPSDEAGDPFPMEAASNLRIIDPTSNSPSQPDLGENAASCNVIKEDSGTGEVSFVDALSKVYADSDTLYQSFEDFSLQLAKVYLSFGMADEVLLHTRSLPTSSEVEYLEFISKFLAGNSAASPTEIDTENLCETERLLLDAIELSVREGSPSLDMYVLPYHLRKAFSTKINGRNSWMASEWSDTESVADKPLDELQSLVVQISRYFPNEEFVPTLTSGAYNDVLHEAEIKGIELLTEDLKTNTFFHEGSLEVFDRLSFLLRAEGASEKFDKIFVLLRMLYSDTLMSLAAFDERRGSFSQSEVKALTKYFREAISKNSNETERLDAELRFSRSFGETEGSTVIAASASANALRHGVFTQNHRDERSLNFLASQTDLNNSMTLFRLRREFYESLNSSASIPVTSTLSGIPITSQSLFRVDGGLTELHDDTNATLTRKTDQARELIESLKRDLEAL